MRIGTRNRNRRRIQVVCLDWGDNSNVSLSMGITCLMVYGVFPNQRRGPENRRNIAEDKPILSSAQETSSSISTPSLKQLADNLQTPARWTMQRFILPSQTILTHPPRGEATHRSFRVNVLHVIYTIPYTITIPAIIIFIIIIIIVGSHPTDPTASTAEDESRTA